jgi:hypothetical protein
VKDLYLVRVRLCTIALAPLHVVVQVVCTIIRICVQHLVAVLTNGIHRFVVRFLPFRPVLRSDFDMKSGHVVPYFTGCSLGCTSYGSFQWRRRQCRRWRWWCFIFFELNAQWDLLRGRESSKLDMKVIKYLLLEYICSRSSSWVTDPYCGYELIGTIVRR